MSEDLSENLSDDRSPDRSPNAVPKGILDPARRQQIIALVANGSSRRVAARFVGCSPSTISRTAARDPQFAADLARAEESVEVESLRAIRDAAKTKRYWRAAAWLLERRNPDDFAPREPGLYRAEQVLAMFAHVLASAAPELPAGSRLRALEKLNVLLIEFDAKKPRAGEGKEGSSGPECSE